LTTDNWERISTLAVKLALPEFGGSSVLNQDFELVHEMLYTFWNNCEWYKIIDLRKLFDPIIARDSIGVIPVLQDLTNKAIVAAEKGNRNEDLAHFLGADGHNLHRRGLHNNALQNFERASKLYFELGNEFESIKNFYMMSLCYRALGNITKAKKILDNVFLRVSDKNPWRGNPLQVLGWMARDERKFAVAEEYFLESIKYQKLTKDPDILVAGSLADLGEVLGFQGKYQEGYQVLNESLHLIRTKRGQYKRQEARTLIKMAELLCFEKKMDIALNILDQADDKVRGHGYDLPWKIELLRAVIYFRKKKLYFAYRKIRSAYYLFADLKLPPSEFYKRVIFLLNHKENNFKF
jgi:tetratricopeptide (TPR) repeat protein